MAAQPPLEREDSLPDRARRQRVHPGRDVEGRGRRRDVQGRRPPLAGNIGHRDRHGARRQAGAERVRDRRQVARDRRRVARLSDYAEGARRRLPARPPASVDPQRAAAGHPADSPRDHQRRPRLLQRPRLHPGRHAHLHAGRVRGHDHAVPGAVLRRADGVSHAERPAVQRSQRDGARPRVLLRADVSRGEVENTPPPHRVLDGRARNGLCRPERRDGAGRGPHRVGRRPRARHAPARAHRPRTRRRQARGGAETVSPDLLRRGGENAPGRRVCRSSGAAISAGRTKRRCRNNTTGR